MDSAEKGRLSILHGTPGVGNNSLRRIMAEFSDLEAFFSAPRSTLERFLPPAAVEAFIERCRGLDPLSIGEMMNSQAVDIVVLGEERYPAALKNIPNPPQLLYCRGQVELGQGPGVAIVGSRKATQYGRKVARELAYQLAEKGLTIISGLARGIDSQAHLGALEAGGTTISVLGSGINIVYPRDNLGFILSEYAKGIGNQRIPPGDAFTFCSNYFSAQSHYFKLALGVLVVRPEKKSGASITADFAFGTRPLLARCLLGSRPG